jgi:hypothetical protein
LPLNKMGDFNNLQQQELQQYLLGNCYATWSLWRQSCAQLQQQRLAMACFFDPQTVSQNRNLCHWAVNVSCTRKKLQETAQEQWSERSFQQWTGALAQL